MEHFDTDAIRRKVAGLPDWKRVAFMGACCERMLPNYGTFSRQTGFGSADALRRALDVAWTWIESDTAPENLPELIAHVDLAAPDSEGHRSIYASAALNAVNGIAMTLEALRNATDSCVVGVASLARDTVDLFVQFRDDLDPSAPDFEEKIARSALMQAELTAQSRSLSALDDEQADRSALAKTIRAEFSQRSLPDA